MSATLGFVIMVIVCFLFVIIVVKEIGKIVIDKKEYLDELIITLEKEKRLEQKVEATKNYMITVESRLNKIQEYLEGKDNG